MKRFIVCVVLMGIVGTLTVATAGTDATNTTMQISLSQTNGTNCIVVKCVYPSSWTNSLRLQTGTDLVGADGYGYWRSITAGELVSQVASPFGELPRWREWWVKRDGIVGVQFFRVKSTLDVAAPPSKTLALPSRTPRWRSWALFAPK